MAHQFTFWLMANVETILCGIALFFLWKNALIKNYAFLAALFAVKLLTSAIMTPVVYLSHHHVLSSRVGYYIYFCTYWSSFAIESALWLMIVYSMYKLAMEPLKGLQSLGMLVFRWAAAISAVITVSMAFAPHVTALSMLQAAVTQFQQTASILTLCLLLFVTFAIRPMGLSYRSRIFGISLGMGILSTAQLVGTAWFSTNQTIYSTFSILVSTCSTMVMGLWTVYFILPEPERRIIVLPTTSPFLRWNQISLALGSNPGFVAVGNVAPSAFAGAELEVMRRASLKMNVTEMDIKTNIATPIAV